MLQKADEGAHNWDTHVHMTSRMSPHDPLPQILSGPEPWVLETWTPNPMHLSELLSSRQPSPHLAPPQA